MAKAGKKKTEPKAKTTREQPLKVNGSFMDIMKAAVKDAKSKDKKKP